jgi:DNA-binding transcriptional regulator LsrR (DeoR family)
MVDDLEHDLLAEVASLYYELDLSQSAIGERLGLSRVKVYRLLKKAKEAQVVQITITWPIERDGRLEEALCESFSLDRALVLKSGPQDFRPNGAGIGLRRLGQMSARHLATALQDGMTLAVCLGRSSYEVINAFRPMSQARVNVAQAMGSIPSAIPDLDSSALARQLASKLGGQILLLTSPLYVNSPAAAKLLRSQPAIERTLKAARNANIALVGIGGISPETSHYVDAELITADQLRQLEAEGAAGDIGGQFIRESGELHPCAINHCMIGLTLDQLRTIPYTIAVAAGTAKVRAILGALRSGVLNALCTDQQTAAELVRLGQAEPSLAVSKSASIAKVALGESDE